MFTVFSPHRGDEDTVRGEDLNKPNTPAVHVPARPRDAYIERGLKETEDNSSAPLTLPARTWLRLENSAGNCRSDRRVSKTKVTPEAESPLWASLERKVQVVEDGEKLASLQVDTG